MRDLTGLLSDDQFHPRSNYAYGREYGMPVVDELHERGVTSAYLHQRLSEIPRGKHQGRKAVHLAINAPLEGGVLGQLNLGIPDFQARRGGWHRSEYPWNAQLTDSLRVRSLDELPDRDRHDFYPFTPESLIERDILLELGPGNEVRRKATTFPNPAHPYGEDDLGLHVLQEIPDHLTDTNPSAIAEGFTKLIHSDEAHKWMMQRAGQDIPLPPQRRKREAPPRPDGPPGGFGLF